MNQLRCPYCLREDVKFGSREHVIPQFLGTFTPKSLLLPQVCDNCNNGFSKLEGIFKEDSVEGCISAQYQLRGDNSIRLRNQRMHFTNRLLGQQRIFDRVFPFVDPITNKAKPVAHIVIEGANKKLLVLMPKAVRSVKGFAERIRWTGAGDGSNLSIFSNGNERLRELIYELRKRGVPFYDGEAEEFRLGRDGEFECLFEGRIDRSIKRVVAKIAFNYFIYCAFASHVENVLYDANFDRIRSYILDATCSTELVDIKNHKLQVDGYEGRQHIPFHFVAISKYGTSLIVEVSLFNHLRYVVSLGKFPFKTIIRSSFGAAHLFDLLEKDFDRFDRKQHCIGQEFALIY